MTSPKTTTQTRLATLQERAQMHEKLTIATAVQDPHALTVLWRCGIQYALGYYIQSQAKNSLTTARSCRCGPNQQGTAGLSAVASHTAARCRRRTFSLLRRPQHAGSPGAAFAHACPVPCGRRPGLRRAKSNDACRHEPTLFDRRQQGHPHDKFLTFADFVTGNVERLDPLPRGNSGNSVSG